MDVHEFLRETEVETMAGSSPIHHALNRGERYHSRHLSIAIQQPDNWESLLTRLSRHEPAMGCFDTSTLVSAGGYARDVARVSIELPWQGELESVSLVLACFMSHLVNEDSVMRFDSDEEDEPDQSRKIAQETSDNLIEEYLLEDAEWRESIRGAQVVELGCGLGLPGLVAHFMGAGMVALTDRGMVADLCRENIESASCKASSMMACELEWTEDGASQLLSDLGGAPDLVLAADCIFLPVYGDANPLLEILRQIVPRQSQGIILLAAERRPRDGVDTFIRASSGEFSVRVAQRTKTTLILEMKRLPA